MPTVQVTANTLGLTSPTQFLQSGTSGSPAFAGLSFGQLLGAIGGSLTTDLLNVLNTIKGFGQNQNKPSGSNADLGSDQTKNGGGYGSIDDTLKKVMKDILKPHD